MRRVPLPFRTCTKTHRPLSETAEMGSGIQFWRVPCHIIGLKFFALSEILDQY